MTSGVERIGARFEALRRGEGGRRGGLIPFVVGGHPSLESLPDVLRALDGAGATVIEVGLPFSDPIADGPVIASAMHEALESGVTVRGVLESASGVAGELSAPLVAMVSVSIVERFGSGVFCGMLKEAGFSGAIFPDAPLEESDELCEAAAGAGLSATLLVAPTTPVERAERIARKSTGFVYMVARTGITGVQEADPSAALGERVSALRGASELPIACGFGVSTARHVALVTEHADAAIVGSALVRRLSEAAGAGSGVAEAAGSFASELACGLAGGPAWAE